MGSCNMASSEFTTIATASAGLVSVLTSGLLTSFSRLPLLYNMIRL